MFKISRSFSNVKHFIKVQKNYSNVKYFLAVPTGNPCNSMDLRWIVWILPTYRIRRHKSCSRSRSNSDVLVCCISNSKHHSASLTNMPHEFWPWPNRYSQYRATYGSTRSDRTLLGNFFWEKIEIQMSESHLSLTFK